jgi:hypothetical protein
VLSLETQNKFLEERIENLQSELRDFERKYRAIADFVEKLKDVIREEIKNLDPTEEDIKAFLLEKLQQAYKYDFALEDLETSWKACKEASNWLYKNRNKLILNIQNLINQGKILPKSFNNSSKTPEQIKQFCKDIELYLKWIGYYMERGDEPTPILSGDDGISFVFPSEAYVEVFKFIRNKRVSTKYGLSEEAVIQTENYLDRFLIEPLSVFKPYGS